LGAQQTLSGRRRKAGKAAVSEFGAGFDEAMTAIYELFGKGKTIGAGPAFDEETYEKAMDLRKMASGGLV